MFLPAVIITASDFHRRSTHPGFKGFDNTKHFLLQSYPHTGKSHEDDIAEQTGLRICLFEKRTTESWIDDLQAARLPQTCDSHLFRQLTACLECWPLSVLQ